MDHRDAKKEIDKEIVIRRFFCNQKIPGLNRTANICVGKFQSPTILYTHLDSIGPIYKSKSRDSLFQNAPAKHRLMF